MRLIMNNINKCNTTLNQPNRGWYRAIMVENSRIRYIEEYTYESSYRPTLRTTRKCHQLEILEMSAFIYRPNSGKYIPVQNGKIIIIIKFFKGLISTSINPILVCTKHNNIKSYQKDIL